MRSLLPLPAAAGIFLALFAGLLVAVREGRFASPGARKRAVAGAVLVALGAGFLLFELG